MSGNENTTEMASTAEAGSDSNAARGVLTMSFEEALAELEAIVRQLETGSGRLEESIAAYERGVALQRHCDAKLAAAQARVEKIVLGRNGAVAAEPANFA